MIKINILYDEVSLFCSIRGHAKYAEYGKDIVCSSISTISQYMLMVLSYKYQMPYNLEKGKMEFYIEKLAKEDLIWIEYFIDVIGIIKKQFPKNIDFVLENETSNTQWKIRQPL